MGRTRKPTKALEASGAFEHDPQRAAEREHEPIPSGPLGDPPEHFTRTQREIWFELALQVPDGVLTVADRMMVEIYCGLVARHRGGVNKDGEPVAPEILKASEYELILKLLGRMGLTPADRSKIKAPTAEKKHAEDTFEELAKQGRRQRGQVTQ